MAEFVFWGKNMKFGCILRNSHKTFCACWLDFKLSLHLHWTVLFYIYDGFIPILDFGVKSWNFGEFWETVRKLHVHFELTSNLVYTFVEQYCLTYIIMVLLLLRNFEIKTWYFGWFWETVLKFLCMLDWLKILFTSVLNGIV